jgi:hypothetical protein
MIQVKNLVSHETYKAVVSRQNELIKQVANYDKKGDQTGLIALQKELGKVMKEVKEELEKQFGEEFFTDKSPLWLSQETDGVMFMPAHQGGGIEVKLEKLD